MKLLLLKSRQKILLVIVRNPGIHVNALMKIIGSIQDIKAILNELEEANLIESKYVGNIRQLFPILNKSLSISIFELVEEEEKKVMMKKFPIIEKLAKRTDSFEKNFGKNLVSILLFGSIARGSLAKLSDIDILFIMKKENAMQKNKLIKLFKTVSLNTGREINPILIEEKEFKKQLKKTTSFCKQIQKERIILYGIKAFLRL